MPSPAPKRIHAGPRTWALAREAYLSGETAQAVCARLGLTVAAFRAQAGHHGWTKRAYADSLVDPIKTRSRGSAGRGASAPRNADTEEGEAEPPPAPLDPRAVAHAAVMRAARDLDEGRTAEAAAGLKVAESLAKLSNILPPPPARFTPEELQARSLARAEGYCADVWATAERLAWALLSDGRGMPSVHCRAAFAWRKANMGEAAAAEDRTQSVWAGSSGWIYDREGNIKPPQTWEEFHAAHWGPPGKAAKVRARLAAEAEARENCLMGTPVGDNTPQSR